MKGEYKVPGGKLIVLEAEERDGHLVDVVISGDFFLEPDDALEDAGQLVHVRTPATSL